MVATTWEGNKVLWCKKCRSLKIEVTSTSWFLLDVKLEIAFSCEKHLLNGNEYIFVWWNCNFLTHIQNNRFSSRKLLWEWFKIHSLLCIVIGKKICHVVIVILSNNISVLKGIISNVSRDNVFVWHDADILKVLLRVLEFWWVFRHLPRCSFGCSRINENQGECIGVL